ncbi:MAG: hypothetical protein P1U58_00025 [Verrucomicrobiales bacterium]|nr:hypothetical protein [Verrucomicrobiales bacterium]
MTVRKLILSHLIFAGFLLVTIPGISQESHEVFASANADFESGELEEAALKYQSLVNNGLISADLFFNLGTTQYRLENPGEAMLWFRRAQLIEPRAPEIPQNVEFLKTKIGFLEFAESGLAGFLRSLPSGTGRWLGSLLLWGGAISLAAAFSIPTLRSNRSGMIALGIILGMFGYVSLRIDRYEKTQLAPGNFATVISTDTKARTAPAPASKEVIALPPGSEVRIIQTSGQWRYVDIPGELRGWVRGEEIEPVWPLPSPQS